LGARQSQRRGIQLAHCVGYDNVPQHAVLVVIALLLVRFLHTGGAAMPRMIDMPADHTADGSARAK